MNDYKPKTSKKMRGKWWQLLLVVAILTTTFSLAAISHPSIVHAGTNGQQITFECSAGLGHVTIRGNNQNGQYVRWNGEGVNGYAHTLGYFWKDKVSIEYVKDGQSMYQENTVPWIWGTDWYYIMCGKWN